MNIPAEVIKKEKLSKADVERLEKMYEEIEEASESMPPEIYQPDATVSVDCRQGGCSFDASVLGSKTNIDKLKRLGKRLSSCSSEKTCEKIRAEIFDLIGSYTEAHVADDIESVEVKEGGWIAHLSMPGYMDQTEPQHYDTLKAAIEDLYNMYVE
jgi:hypothetical protein